MGLWGFAVPLGGGWKRGGLGVWTFGLGVVWVFLWLFGVPWRVLWVHRRSLFAPGCALRVMDFIGYRYLRSSQRGDGAGCYRLPMFHAVTREREYFPRAFERLCGSLCRVVGIKLAWRLFGWAFAALIAGAVTRERERVLPWSLLGGPAAPRFGGSAGRLLLRTRPGLSYLWV